MVYREPESFASGPAEEVERSEVVDVDLDREFGVLVSLPQERDLSESDLRFALVELGIESDSSGERLEAVYRQGTGGGDLFRLLGVLSPAGGGAPAARRYSGVALSMDLLESRRLWQ